MKSMKQWLVGMIAMVASFSLVIGFGASALAQDAESDTDDLADADLFAAIYAGTCDNLGADPLYQLGDVLPTGEASTEGLAGVQTIGYEDVETMLVLETNIEAGLLTLFQQDQVHSLVVQDRQGTDGDYVACGELGGVMVNGQVAVGLTGTDGLEACGVAIFGDEGEEQLNEVDTLTPVRLYLFESAMGDDGVQVNVAATQPVVVPDGTPEGTPAVEPTLEPTVEPTIEPTVEPTIEPTIEPTAEPTVEPTVEPTLEPTVEPTIEPTIEPTAEPTAEPTVEDPE